MRYYVYYCNVPVAIYKNINACIKYIQREKLQEDYFHQLSIIDKKGDMYNPITGTKLK